MARKRYIETHSNYTLKQLHQLTQRGAVFERDYTSISEMDSFAPGQVPVYADGNMKMTTRRVSNRRLKHNYGGLLKNNCGGEITDVWTLGCIEGTSAATSASEIRIRPNTSDLFDFACYGSAVELIRSTASDILLKFPAELYLSNRRFEYYEGDDENLHYLGEKDSRELYIVENPFGINIYASTYQEGRGVNKLRYLCESADQYDFIADGFKEIAPVSWSVPVQSNKKAGCFVDGDFIMSVNIGECTLYYYYYQGEKILLHDYKRTTAHVRPTGKVLEEFYDSLDDFEYILLDRATDRTAKLDTPKETDKGLLTRPVKYQWPIKNGWNLDFESMAYENYIDSLTSLAEMYDTYYSDYITRALTHEAIKNFDWTNRTIENDVESEEQHDPNPYRMEAILHIYGRMFDELRRYVHNIKNTNNVTYNGESNVPDYFLSDKLELAGWNVKNPLTFGKEIVTEPLYPALYYGNTANDANNLFMRFLLLSTREILAAKGTKRGIETLLALFGFHSEDYYKKRTYEIVNSGGTTEVVTWEELPEDEKKKYIADSYKFSEFVTVAVDNANSDAIGYTNCDYDTVVNINKFKDTFNFRFKKGETYLDHALQGLPVKGVILDTGGTETVNYLIPWFDAREKYDTPSEFYFQSRGGWGKQDTKNVNVSTYGPIGIASDENFTIYDENIKYLHFASDIQELLTLPYSTLNKGDVYYVEDMSDFNESESYSGTPSHYLCLMDEDGAGIIGYTESGVEGWRVISDEEIINQTSTEGKKVAYLESIVEDKDGMCMHIGHGQYDGGKYYTDRFEKIFSGSYFNKVSEEKVIGYDTLGFNLERQEDNIKCWYFTDTNSDSGNLVHIDGNSIRPNELVLAGSEFISGETKTLRGTDLIPFNMEDKEYGYTCDEAAANSIINLKELELSFYPNTKLGYSMYDFIHDVVMFYAKQLIPSTTLLSFHIPNIGINEKGDQMSNVQDVCGDGGNAFGAVDDGTIFTVDTDAPFLTAINETREAGASEDSESVIKVILNTGELMRDLEIEPKDSIETYGEDGEQVTPPPPKHFGITNEKVQDVESDTTGITITYNSNITDIETSMEIISDQDNKIPPVKGEKQ